MRQSLRQQKREVLLVGFCKYCLANAIKKSKKIVPTLVSSSGTTHTHLAARHEENDQKRQKQPIAGQGGLPVIERIEQREAEFSSGTISMLSDKEDEDNVHMMVSKDWGKWR